MRSRGYVISESGSINDKDLSIEEEECPFSLELGTVVLSIPSETIFLVS
jgi:hypothetical protein